MFRALVLVCAVVAVVAEDPPAVDMPVPMDGPEDFRRASTGITGEGSPLHGFHYGNLRRIPGAISDAATYAAAGAKHGIEQNSPAFLSTARSSSEHVKPRLQQILSNPKQLLTDSLHTIGLQNGQALSEKIFGADKEESEALAERGY